MVNDSYLILSIVCQEPSRLDIFYLYGLIYEYVFLSCVHNSFVYDSYIIVCMFILCIHVCHSPCWRK